MTGCGLMLVGWSRYIDLFTGYVSLYNTSMKVRLPRSKQGAQPGTLTHQLAVCSFSSLARPATSSTS